MIFFVISCFSFILLSNSFSSKDLMVPSSRLLAWFWRELSHFVMVVLGKSVIAVASLEVSKEAASGKAENVKGEEKTCLLDLPELAMDCILERLSPAGLSSMAGVCTSLRERCASDHLWERHMKQKWGRIINDVACREWQWQIASTNRSTLSNGTKRKAIFGYFSGLWLLLSDRSKLGNGSRTGSFLQRDSIMACYIALETGKFWFPAQVYNRENGHVGFMLSCYDAELSYDSSTDTFRARYSPYGRRTIEENIEWHRVRAPAVDTPAHVLHASDCLDDLRPGDHIEIQWRRNKEFPYGWWYGLVGHLESCNGNITQCQCHDTIILEFKQYTPGSRWRRAKINRKNHREIGNGADGFYGGIRKLYNDKDISVWRRLWPNQVLE
ncbi:F-box protein At2g32560-like isoform X2 [Diospyros lotus]|uniref:F-box protein At2g32560-like isoform X2 n=1 Tax=Diospyros lotus TaxID=55363 RepID=UPI002257C455|nr:F-box protein At2g32560-like isoform X2 [Diospyros lotus]